MKDLLFLDKPKIRKSLSITIGDQSAITEGSALTVRCGSLVSETLFGSSTEVDPSVSRFVFSKSVASDISDQLTNCQVINRLDSRQLVLIPRSNLFVGASYPVDGAFSFKVFSVRMPQRLGDISLSSSGDFDLLDREQEEIQDMIIRIISSKNSDGGFNTSWRLCAGFDNWVGRGLTRELLSIIERDIYKALTMDGRFDISQVRAIPLDRNSVQPVVYRPGRAVNIPVVINTSTGLVTLETTP